MYLYIYIYIYIHIYIYKNGRSAGSTYSSTIPARHFAYSQQIFCLKSTDISPQVNPHANVSISDTARPLPDVLPKVNINFA